MRRRRMPALAVHAAETVLGRRRLARYARFLTNEVRRDVPNEIAHNGETSVQQAALSLDVEPVVFDVGAHYGEWSAKLLDQSGTEALKLYMFEPSGNCHQEVSTRLGPISEAITIERLALSDRNGEMLLHIPHQGAASNSLVPFHDFEHARGKRSGQRHGAGRLL